LRKNSRRGSFRFLRFSAIAASPEAGRFGQTILA